MGKAFTFFVIKPVEVSFQLATKWVNMTIYRENLLTKGEMKMLTLFLFQRELIQLQNEYRSSADNIFKSQILKDITLLTAAIKEMKEIWEDSESLARNI